MGESRTHEIDGSIRHPVKVPAACSSEGCWSAACAQESKQLRRILPKYAVGCVSQTTTFDNNINKDASVGRQN